MAKQEKELRTRQDFFNAFLKVLPTVAQGKGDREIFRDACRVFSLSFRGAVTICPTEKEAIEKEYQTYVEQYGKEGMEKMCRLLGYVVEGLECERRDFLGRVYEKLDATQKSFGQYLTPDCVARVMAQYTLGEMEKGTGKILRFSDCACGAGALLIEAAEEYMRQGGSQSDLVLFADDLDATACCIAYVQFSLLGYAAVVRHQDSLAGKVLEGPWYTVGYYAHGIPMRTLATQ